MTDSNANSVAGLTLVVNLNQNIANILHLSVQSQAHSGHPRLASHRFDVFDFQWKVLMHSVFSVSSYTRDPFAWLKPEV